jgi:hypothetical protein
MFKRDVITLVDIVGGLIHSVTQHEIIEEILV